MCTEEMGKNHDYYNKPYPGYSSIGQESNFVQVYEFVCHDWITARDKIGWKILFVADCLLINISSADICIFSNEIISDLLKQLWSQ